MPVRAHLTALLIALAASVSLAHAAPAPIAVNGQISVPGGVIPKDAKALLVPLATKAEGMRLDLVGKAEPEPVVTVPVGADGSFRISVPDAGVWKVVVQAPGFVPRVHPLIPLVQETDLPGVKLERDQRLEVRVTGPDGRPLPGARVSASASVSVFRRQGWQVASRVAVADAQGVAVLPRSAEEGLVVRAGVAGLPFAERKDVRSASVSLSVAAGPSRTVRVVDALGKPVEGAFVSFVESGWVAGTTGKDGLLAVPLPSKAKTAVTVDAGGAGDVRSVSVFLEPARPGQNTETGPLELRLPAMQSISGRVVSMADGRPVAGALMWSSDPGAFRRTGADGSYTLDGIAGRDLMVSASAPGFFEEQVPWPMRPGERRGPTLTLEPAFSVSGTVVDEQGAPVAGVEIKAGLKPGSRPSSPGGWGSGGNAFTGAAGTFRISTLYPGIAHEVRFTRKGFASATEELAPLQPGRPAAPLRVVLRKGRTAFGRVVTAADEPVSGARLVLEPDLSGGSMMFRMGRMWEQAEALEAASDANGRFEIPDLPAGSFKLTASGSGHAPITVPGLTVPEGGGSVDLGTVVLMQGVALEGFVTSGGKPVQGARILLSETSGDPFAGIGKPDAAPAAISGQDGFFRIEDRRAGESVDIDVLRSGFAPGAAPGVVVPAEEPVRIVLKPTSAVEGRTVDPDGKPVPGTRLFLMPTGPTAMGGGSFVFTSESMRDAVSGEDGLFRMEDVPAGSFELSASASGRQTTEMTNLEVRSGQDLTGVEVVMAPGAIVEGRVLASGRPVPGARVELVMPRSSGISFSFNSTEAAADGDGYYRIDGVAPGTRTFQATAKGFRKGGRELEVKPGGNDLDFNLEGGVEISGRVVDEDGLAVGAALVTLREGRSSWNLPNAVSAPDGSFTLSGVADGTYRIAAEKEGYARSSEGKELTVAGAAVSGVEVELSRGGAIVGQLSGLDFTELSQVGVWVDNEYQSGRVSPDGSYRIENVQPGERRVVASVRGARQAEGKVTLKPGDREARLDLEFKEGHLLSGRILRNGEAARGEHVILNGPGVAGRWGKSDHEGRFRFEGLEPGTYELEVMDRRGQANHRESVELDGDHDVLVELDTVSLVGRTVDSADRSPIQGVRVSLLPPEGEGSASSYLALEAVTDSKGEFRLPDVPDGKWRVRAMLEGYAPGEVALQLTGSPVDDLEIPLQATEGVTLDVLLASGRAPEAVQSAVLDAAGKVVAASTYPVGENGRVRIASMAPGSWELLLKADGTATVSLAVTAPGHAGRVLLPVPGTLDLKVPALAGARIKAEARLTGADGKLFRIPWGDARSAFELDSGSLKLDSLPPGAWKVDVTAADGRSWTGTATLVPGTTVPVTLE